ncbi:cytochrome c biogenesis protein CcsA [Altererythrobacter sp. SALINAS58]|uniref:heme ABC transporter permease CcmC n=1 Tax=Alteripontixanthobacter muriae TaxID=2705546 RepID=UPI0015762AA0|nr:heme ABC transporter permease CcmC [Alteripontixanthobacter muriae]NTZ42386.1 cytochrome c biogenesis protein CcsA [Alteripontixanthobacter muriae]
MHGFANPKRFLSLARWLTPLFMLSGLLLAAIALAWGLFAVPPDRLMGETVRIMFIHVPAAWLGMGGWTALAIASLVYLVWRHPLADIAARAVALPGLVFTVICLVTGSIWGRPTWGTWWVWDGRLTSMLVLAFLYLGYIALAQAVAREGASARIPAIFGLVGAVNIPIINRSVVWWNSLHQPPSITMGNSTIDSQFLVPLLLATAGFSLLMGGIVLARMRTVLADMQAEARFRRKVATSGGNHSHQASLQGTA